MTPTPLQSLAEYGQSPWLDGLARTSRGELERLVREHGIRGVASMHGLAPRDPEAILWGLAVSDVRHACDVLRPVWRRTGGADGYVSVAVDPRLADDTTRSCEQAERMRALVDRPNFMVEIAATPAGVLAVEETIASGIAVHAAPIYSLERYREVAEAYRRGIERLLQTRGDATVVAAVAGVSVARIDAELDRGLETRLRGRLAIANAKLIYDRHKQACESSRWRALEARGAHRMRCLWCSEASRRLFYVEELIGADTVCALSLETAEAFEREGVLADKLERGLEDARRTVAEIEAAGVDLNELWSTLEAQAARTRTDRFAAVIARLA